MKVTKMNKEILSKLRCTSGEQISFNSLNEFYEYIENTKTNETFSYRSLSSKTGSYSFTGTKSYEEAIELFKNGWSEAAEKLNNKVKQKIKTNAVDVRRKQVYSVAGYQVSVPRYLQGNPCSMISNVSEQKKQKIVELTKDFSYSCVISKETIFEESAKALHLVYNLEKQGYRVKLNIGFCTQANSKVVATKICIKQPNERLNISKMAFPLAHTSMLRRLMFRFVETYPGYTSGFANGYGNILENNAMKMIFSESKKSYMIPRIMKQRNVNEIKSLEEL